MIDPRLLRGGAWPNHSWACRSAVRDHFLLDCAFCDVGFRVICRDSAGHTIPLEEQSNG